MARPSVRKKPVKEKRDVSIAFRITPSLKRSLAKAADADRRTVSAFIEMLIEEGLQARGFLK
jgi:hypothetical protein